MGGEGKQGARGEIGFEFFLKNFFWAKRFSRRVPRGAKLRLVVALFIEQPCVSGKPFGPSIWGVYREKLRDTVVLGPRGFFRRGRKGATSQHIGVKKRPDINVAKKKSARAILNAAGVGERRFPL